MSKIGTDESGNSEKDWEIFDVLCNDANTMPKHHHHTLPAPLHHDHLHHHTDALCDDSHHLTHSLDLATTLRSELAASTYKRDRLMSELTEVKSSLCAKDTECESLRAQNARQTALITSLQHRLQGAESREKNLQMKNEANHATFHREKKVTEEKHKELCAKIRRLEHGLANEESHHDQVKTQLHDFVRKLCVCLGIDVCDSAHLTPEVVLSKCGEVVSELQRLRTKLASTCEHLNTTEQEFLSLKSATNAERSRLQSQLESLQAHNQGLDSRCRSLERDLQITRERLTESDVVGEKLKEEIRGLESRCNRIQSNFDRVQSDRLQYLRQIAGVVNVNEPCETLIKDKLKELVHHNQSMHAQLAAVRDQLASEGAKHRDFHDQMTCRVKSEEAHRASAEERLEKLHHEVSHLKGDHYSLAEYLMRLSRALAWSECSSPPAPGHDTNILCDTLLERAERLTAFHDHHVHDKHAWEHTHSAPHHHHSLPKLRRERSCHDIPLKESVSLYTLQKKVRVLREQVQRRDLHLELLRRKLALLEDHARGKAALQTERDEAIHRSRKNARHAEKTTAHLHEVKAQLAEVKSQLAEAADYKIAALERARKIDELQTRVMDLENEKSRLLSQLAHCKSRYKSISESSSDRRCRDETTIQTLRDEISHLKHDISESNHRITHLQTFKHSVSRLLHMRDMPDSNILHRLHSLCNAHQEFSSHAKRYEAHSPIRDCSSPPTSHHVSHRPFSSSPVRRFSDSSLHDHFGDDFKF